MKKTIICIALILAVFFVGCQSADVQGNSSQQSDAGTESNPAEQTSTTPNSNDGCQSVDVLENSSQQSDAGTESNPAEQTSTTPNSNDKTPIKDPPLRQSVEIRNLEKLNKMREMASCDDEMQVEQYVQSIADSGIQSKDELIAFVKMVDSLPHIPVLDGSITWLCFSHSISEDTGEETNVVYVTTEAANGDWTRVEYVLSVTDAAERISDEKISMGESSALASPLKTADGKLTLHIESRTPHPSGKGTMIQWIGEVSGIFTRIYYYTANEEEVKTDDLFSSIQISDISQ